MTISNGLISKGPAAIDDIAAYKKAKAKEHKCRFKPLEEIVKNCNFSEIERGNYL